MKPIIHVLFDAPADIKNAEDNIITSGNSEFVTIKGEKNTERVDRKELGLGYYKVPGVFNGINKTVQNIMSAGNKIICSDKKIQAYFDKFLDNIGNSGTDITRQAIFKRIFTDKAKYGISFVHKIHNKSGNKIVDLDVLDPERMDYAKDSRGNIVFDKDNVVVGFVQTLPDGIYSEDKPALQKFPVPIEVDLSFDELYLPKSRVAVFKLYPVSDNFYPVGLIEPAYKSLLRKLNLEEAYSNAAYRHVYPTIWAQIGDELHHPTIDQLEMAVGKIKLLNYKTEIATPYYHKLNMLQARDPQNLSSTLDYFEDEYVMSIGAPKPFTTSSGEETNRSTLVIQDRMWQLCQRELIEDTLDEFRNQIFKPISKYENFNEVPYIVWGDVGLEERSEKIKRVLEYLNAQIIDKEKAKQLIFELEGYFD